MRTLFDGMACIWLQAWRAIGDADILWAGCFRVLSFAYQVLILNGKFVLNSTILSYTTIHCTHFNQIRRKHCSVELLRDTWQYTFYFFYETRRGQFRTNISFLLQRGKGLVEVECSSSFCASFLSFREERKDRKSVV